MMINLPDNKRQVVLDWIEENTSHIPNEEEEQAQESMISLGQQIRNSLLSAITVELKTKDVELLRDYLHSHKEYQPLHDHRETLDAIDRIDDVLANAVSQVYEEHWTLSFDPSVF